LFVACPGDEVASAQCAFGASYQPSAISHQLFVSACGWQGLGPQVLGLFRLDLKIFAARNETETL
jgi:hypothetical protein